MRPCSRRRSRRTGERTSRRGLSARRVPAPTRMASHPARSSSIASASTRSSSSLVNSSVVWGSKPTTKLLPIVDLGEVGLVGQSEAFGAGVVDAPVDRHRAAQDGVGTVHALRLAGPGAEPGECTGTARSLPGVVHFMRDSEPRRTNTVGLFGSGFSLAVDGAAN